MTKNAHWILKFYHHHHFIINTIAQSVKSVRLQLSWKTFRPNGRILIENIWAFELLRPFLKFSFYKSWTLSKFFSGKCEMNLLWKNTNDTKWTVGFTFCIYQTHFPFGAILRQHWNIWTSTFKCDCELRKKTNTYYIIANVTCWKIRTQKCHKTYFVGIVSNAHLYLGITSHDSFNASAADVSFSRLSLRKKKECICRPLKKKKMGGRSENGTMQVISSGKRNSINSFL